MPQRVQSKRDHYECKQRSEYQISQNPEMKINSSSRQDLPTNKNRHWKSAIRQLSLLFTVKTQRASKTLFHIFLARNEEMDYSISINCEFTGPSLVLGVWGGIWYWSYNPDSQPFHSKKNSIAQCPFWTNLMVTKLSCWHRLRNLSL